MEEKVTMRLKSSFFKSLIDGEFREMYRKMEQVKLVKVFEKCQKLEVVINLSRFNDPGIILKVCLKNSWKKVGKVFIKSSEADFCVIL